MGKPLPFTNALNERTALFDVAITPASGLLIASQGHVTMKIDADYVYYLWNIGYELLAEDGKFAATELPQDQDPFEYTLAKAIAHINRYQGRTGDLQITVQAWDWKFVNLDLNQLQRLIEGLEMVEKRTRMYIRHPYEIDTFLWGWRSGCQALGFRFDWKAYERAFSHVGIVSFPESSDTDADRAEYTWELVKQLLQVEIRTWRWTYGLAEVEE